MLIARKKPGEEDTRRPSTPLLVSLNALLFLGISAVGTNIFGQVLAVIATIAYVGLCGIWHGTIVVAERRYRLSPLFRTLLFLAPLLLLLLLPVLGITSPPPENQVTPLASPSGRYELRVYALRYWDLRLRDLENAESERIETDFAGHFDIYWDWDEEDRLWVFNNEFRRIYFWERTDAGWEQKEYDPDEHPDLEPPEIIVPEYLKRVVKSS